jgi:hypothetical protein
MLRSAKDGLELGVPGVYRIPRECVNVYLGHSGRTIEDSCDKNKRYVCQHQPEKSAVAEHSISTLLRFPWHFIVRQNIGIRGRHCEGSS